jgi:hypothetical protein
MGPNVHWQTERHLQLVTRGASPTAISSSADLHFDKSRCIQSTGTGESPTHPLLLDMAKDYLMGLAWWNCGFFALWNAEMSGLLCSLLLLEVQMLGV